MTILVVPYLGCNIKCKYCFAHGYDWVKTPQFSYNLDAMLASMDRMHKSTCGDTLCMHGGECTQIPRDDFEAILKKMFELQGSSSIQTNAYELDNDLIRLFKRYKTHVGVSIDGDGDLNVLRGGFEPAKNQQYTQQVLSNIFKLQEEGISVGVITLLHKANASDTSKLEKLVQFLKLLSSHGISGGRLNIMWTNVPEVKQYELTPQEASNAWLYLYNNLKQYKNLQWQPFREMVDNLLGFGHSSCSLGKCDYFCTYGAKVILADGSLGNCDRTHQEGSVYTRAAEKPSYERYEAMKATDCNACRYWNVCYGGCPAEGKDSDWRNKTRFCQAIYDLYSAIENDVKTMFPNIKLITDYQGQKDYFDMFLEGNKINAFEKMSFATAYDPSTWRCVRKKENTSATAPYQNVPHGDYTDHGDSLA